MAANALLSILLFNLKTFFVKQPLLVLFSSLIIFCNVGCKGPTKSSSVPERKELEKAETQVIKIAVVIEDPLIGGKRFHEMGKWNNPRDMYPKIKEVLEECSGGVVKYEIVKVIESDRLFTYFKENENKPDRHFTNEQLKSYYIDDPKWTKIREHEKGWNILYDYLSMVKHYGFEDMREKDEVNEVWVCSFTVNGMYESNYVAQTGKGFWLNSDPTGGASNSKLLTVMYYNYERGIAEAIHSNGHRVESIMKEVYGRWATCPPAEEYVKGMELNNWEKFSFYDELNPGHGQIGNIHFPVNGVKDYDYTNDTKKVTYRKSWKYYPDLQFLETDKEEVDRTTWKNMANGNEHLGCMINFFSHLPNKKGINPHDGKLNNWWHYIVNYESALALEKALKK